MNQGDSALAAQASEAEASAKKAASVAKAADAEVRAAATDAEAAQRVSKPWDEEAERLKLKAKKAAEMRARRNVVEDESDGEGGVASFSWLAEPPTEAEIAAATLLQEDEKL